MRQQGKENRDEFCYIFGCLIGLRVLLLIALILRASGGILGASGDIMFGPWAAYSPVSLCQGCDIIPMSVSSPRETRHRKFWPINCGVMRSTTNSARRSLNPYPSLLPQWKGRIERVSLLLNAANAAAARCCYEGVKLHPSVKTLSKTERVKSPKELGRTRPEAAIRPAVRPYTEP